MKEVDEVKERRSAIGDQETVGGCAEGGRQDALVEILRFACLPQASSG